MGLPALNLNDDIKPISDLRSKASSMVKQVQESGRPVVITQHGRSAAVLLDITTYQEMVDELEVLRDISISRKQYAEGEVIGHQALVDSLRKQVDHE